MTAGPAAPHEHRAQALIAAAGHALVLIAFLLPWVGGEFGPRATLSGLSLARLAGDAAANDLGGHGASALALRVALFAVPVLAVDALAMLGGGSRLGFSTAALHRAAVLFALPVAAVAAATGAVTLSAARSSTLIDGLEVGWYLLVVGVAVTLSSAWIAAAARRFRAAR